MGSGLSSSPSCPAAVVEGPEVVVAPRAVVVVAPPAAVVVGPPSPPAHADHVELGALVGDPQRPAGYERAAHLETLVDHVDGDGGGSLAAAVVVG